MSFKIENNIVTVKKDCKVCEHINICKYHSKMKDLCNSNGFYAMNEYLEYNNSLQAFEEHARCNRFFKLNYVIPDDYSLTLKIDEEIIDEIIRLEMPDNVTQWYKNIGDNIVNFSIKNSKPIIIKITDLLIKYQFKE